MKKIIGFFKVLFHIQKELYTLRSRIAINEDQIKLSLIRANDLYTELAYLSKFTLELKQMPKYEIGQTVFFYPDESIEKKNEENKVSGKIQGIYAVMISTIDKFPILNPEYQYQYRIASGYVDRFILESEIIM